jgi:hypothetical protein
MRSGLSVADISRDRSLIGDREAFHGHLIQYTAPVQWLYQRRDVGIRPGSPEGLTAFSKHTRQVEATVEVARLAAELARRVEGPSGSMSWIRLMWS